MRIENPPVIRLVDYQVPDYLIDHVDLDIRLAAEATHITSKFSMRPNPAGRADAPLKLDGEELKLLAVTLDGNTLNAGEYSVSADALLLPALPKKAFTLEIVTEVNPAANTRLMGLYRSNGVYCTQCEADGFRRITYCLDRPDVMSIYRVRMSALKSEAPLLLCNGNPVEAGNLADGWHYAIWEDPHKKPCYLFALVAGDLDAVTGHHTTPSGRHVTLNVYVERGKAARATYAMDALIRSMRWDEEKFGREYDLDLFNIVAVSDFNMGAMENKGLNVFNDRYILASPDTATDQDYHNIEAVVAHEYFHNWTGNRITCRDWFQLCLKEGLTVFRDQEFSSDQRSRPVERIANVVTLRATQFVEDAGPLSHPVRPQEYKEINNFYTATVYNKGSELIQMIKLMIGAEAFRAGMDLYFDRHDGEAATVEQFITCFADVSKRDFTQFMRWYDQAGTPRLRVNEHYDAAARTYRLDFAQITGPTPGQPEKHPQVIPIKLGLLAESGETLVADDLVIMTEATTSKSWSNIPSRPIPSLLRGFSAPVILDIARQEGDLLKIAAHDSDSFNRWQALQDCAVDLLKRSVTAIRAGEPALTDPHLAAAMRGITEKSAGDPAFAALALTLPTEADMAREIGSNVDPGAIGQALDALRRAIGESLQAPARAVYTTLSMPIPFSPDGANAGRRALRGRLLSYLTAADPREAATLALNQMRNANTMTDRVSALGALVQGNQPECAIALDEFAGQYGEDPLTLDLWFGLSARILDGNVITRMEGLLAHPKFTLTNPNRVRGLIGAFSAGNLRAFHAPDGSGYALVARVINDVDARNPQVAARLATSFRTWKNLEPQRRAQVATILGALSAKGGFSRDLSDILERTLK